MSEEGNRMKFARFKHKKDARIRVGVLKEGEVEEVKGDIFTQWERTGNVYSTEDITLEVPFLPGKIIAVGKNYIQTEAERPSDLPKLPIFFLKPSSSLIATDHEIILPKGIEKVKFESELAVVIGKETKDISEEEALDHVFGYTIANDVTASEYFHPDGHWTLGKSFDTFLPLGPFVQTELELASTSVAGYVNDEKWQDSPVSSMIMSVSQMIAYLSSIMTLSKGDVILTGTPVGAGLVGEGVVIDCVVDGIGVLRNKVVKMEEKEPS